MASYSTSAQEAQKQKTKDQNECLKGFQVLLAGGSENKRGVLREQLAKWGCLVGEASDLDEAIETLCAGSSAAKAFHAAMICVQKCGSQAKDLAKRIREQKAISSTKLILLTSEECQSSHPCEMDFDSILTEPIKRSKLLAAFLEAAKTFMEPAGAAGNQKEPPMEQGREEEGDPVELARLDEIACGDKEFELDLIETFITASQTHLTSLETAINHNDAPAVELEGHSLKGASANMGAKGMQELSFRLEKMGAGGTLDSAEEVLEALRVAYEKAASFLKEYSQR